MTTKEQKPVFRDLTAEDPEPEVTEIESLCMNCHKNGITRLLLTRIPHYKNVILMSFSCEECGFENNEIQSGGAFAEKGVKFELEVCTQEDLNRQVVKSDYTAVTIPELDIEIPAQSQKGEITTVEGIINRIISGLNQDQERRRLDHPEESEKIDAVIEKLKKLCDPGEKWTLILDDVSGNCFVENPSAPRVDPRCRVTHYTRSTQQDHALGIYARGEVSVNPSPDSSLLAPAAPTAGSYEQMSADEVLQFRTNCPNCNAPADTNMKLTEIPYFKQVVIMATICDACGHKTNEVKSGGGIEEKGVRFEVRIAGKEDFSRDILKSETCSLEIPELEVCVGGRALGGRFTTAEGILTAMRDQLREGVAGDAPVASRDSVIKVISELDSVLSCNRPVTLVLDDPAGNSYVQTLTDDGTPDDGLKVTHYERSYEQNDELGLNDMKTEGYEES